MSRWLLLALLPFTFGFNWDDVNVDKAVSGGAKLFKAANGLSDKDEIAIGREVAANLAARYSLNLDSSTVTYINLVGQTLVRRSDRKIPYHFGVLRSSEVNAFAAPGGYIFVTDGLLAALQDESELAGVLAHEISHVNERHIAKEIRQANILGASQDLAAAGGADTDRYAPFSDFSIRLLSRGYSRKDELQADALGTELAARAGHDPAGLRRIIERLSKREGKDLLSAPFDRTHPKPKDRFKAIDPALKELTAPGAKNAVRFHASLPHRGTPR